MREAGADGWLPHVVYIPESGRYVMVFNATVCADFKQEAKSTGGIRLAEQEAVSASQLTAQQERRRLRVTPTVGSARSTLTHLFF